MDVDTNNDLPITNQPEAAALDSVAEEAGNKSNIEVILEKTQSDEQESHETIQVADNYPKDDITKSTENSSQCSIQNVLINDTESIPIITRMDDVQVSSDQQEQCEDSHLTPNLNEIAYEQKLPTDVELEQVAEQAIIENYSDSFPTITQDKQNEKNSENVEETENIESNLMQNSMLEVNTNIVLKENNVQISIDDDNKNNGEKNNILQDTAANKSIINTTLDDNIIDSNLTVSEDFSTLARGVTGEPQVSNKDDNQGENKKYENAENIDHEVAELHQNQDMSQHKKKEDEEGSEQVTQLKTEDSILQEEPGHNLVENECTNANNEDTTEVNNGTTLNTFVEESMETFPADNQSNNENVSVAEDYEENVITNHSNINETREHGHIVESRTITEHTEEADSIEQQISNIVQGEDDSDRDARTLSIVEAISRDFDETDSEDVDKPDSVESKSLEIADDNVVMGVNISDQLEHGGVTVTDTSGQIYYVQSVEDLIVVENDDMSTTLDQPEPFEVTVVSDVEESGQQESNSSKMREKPPIPSHILGRNINNPVIDTFRNGKVPPKPRLGVKIPYKNLTSQIVSKDEIAKEILDRQKQKYKQTGQTTREMLFAKKLTQRLAKKIAPPASSVKTTTIVHSTEKDVPINNSDLIAILEGDKDTDSKKRVEDEDASSSKSNKDETTSKKTPKDAHSIKKEDTQPAPLSKSAEREIALKQLQELPVSTGRRRRHASNLLLKKTREIEPMSAGTDSHTKQTLQELQQKESKILEEPVQKKTAPKDPTSTDVGSEVEGKNLVEISPDTKIEKEKHSVEKGTNEETKTKVDIKLAEESAVRNDEKECVEINEPVVPLETHVQKPILTNSDHMENPSEKIDSPKSNEAKQSVNQKMNEDPKKTEIVPKSTIPIKTVENVKGTEKVSMGTKDDFAERKLSNPPVKTYTRKRKSTDEPLIISNVPDKKPTVTERDVNIPPNTYVTKSSRVIKKKVIWDPDEPSTLRSLAGKSSKVMIVKEKVIKSDVSSKKLPTKLPSKTEIYKSPSKSPDISKAKKRLSEVDKLLMDEGAVNMLYSVKNIDDATKKKKSGLISLDRAQKELMNKTNELKKDLKTNSDKVSPKSLRKKESPNSSPDKKIIPASVSRKKSKDSSRSSLHSPPASPSMVYSNHAEASRIIRRHSSSSYSSMDGDFDAEKKMENNKETTPVDSEKSSKKRNAPSSIEGNKSKKVKKSVDKENTTDTLQKRTVTEDTTKSVHKLDKSDEKKESDYQKYKTFSVKQTNHMVQIILLPSFNNEAYLTPEILSELCNIMKELEEDSSCTVVVISSSASAFCNGINYKTLLIDKEQSRKAFAKKLATCVTNFFRVLAKFPKILIAGVHGDTVGLGVTILPLFDMVIASDTATFSIPNAKLGCAAEGGSLLSLPHLMHNVLVSELLYASRKLIAAEALRLGMVTRVLWPDKFQQELLSIVKSISNYSPQFMQLTKKQLRHHMTQHIEEALNNEVDTLIQHWISSECQKNFGVYG